MSATDPVSAAADRGLGCTLEDQLHRTRDQLCLAVDLFDLLAVTPGLVGRVVGGCVCPPCARCIGRRVRSCG